MAPAMAVPENWATSWLTTPIKNSASIAVRKVQAGMVLSPLIFISTQQDMLYEGCNEASATIETQITSMHRLITQSM
jgi:hypothetical protein